MPYLAPRSLDDVLAEIRALDLEPIKSRIALKDKSSGWTNDHAERIAFDYRCLLALLVMYPDRPTAPTSDVERFWQEHIRDTRKYALDCERIFGGVLLQHPHLGLTIARALHLAIPDFRQMESANDDARPIGFVGTGRHAPFRTLSANQSFASPGNEHGSRQASEHQCSTTEKCDGQDAQT